jgi:hypothetical protein
MKARMRRNARPGSGLGLLGILMVLGLGCGSSAPAAQEPAPAPAPGTASEPVPEPASEPAPNDAVSAEDEPAVGQAQGDPPQSGQLDIGESENKQTPAPEPAPGPSREVQELVQESEEAARKGLYGQARRLCSKALEIEPAQPRAVIVCAIAACNLNNERLAKRYYALAATEDRQRHIYQICRSKGIELRE